MFHSLSLLSSSFVEEEHQTFYFLVMTAELMILWLNVKHYVDIRNKEFAETPLVACVGVCVISRVLRSWNQTGDKWEHLHDVGDWLNR